MKKVKKYWLVKSEPVSYNIDSLKKDMQTAWTGVRNFLARNYMRQMQVGDSVLFYHSSCKDIGVYGVAKVLSLPYADPTQFDANGDYFEPRATEEKPVWDLVDIAFVQKCKNPVLLPAIRSNVKLKSMMILEPRNRLSVTPVTRVEFEEILNMAKEK